MLQAAPLQHVTGLTGSGGKQTVPEALSPIPHAPVEEAEQTAFRKRSVISHLSQQCTPSTGEIVSPTQHVTPAPLHCTGDVSQMFVSLLQVKPF